jgi:hypothetical protein
LAAGVSSPQRRRELQAERLARWEAEDAERHRLANRTWYEKIEECESVYDLKAVLHEMLALIEEKEDKL